MYLIFEPCQTCNCLSLRIHNHIKKKGQKCMYLSQKRIIDIFKSLCSLLGIYYFYISLTDHMRVKSTRILVFNELTNIWINCIIGKTSRIVQVFILKIQSFTTFPWKYHFFCCHLFRFMVCFFLEMTIYFLNHQH